MAPDVNTRGGVSAAVAEMTDSMGVTVPLAVMARGEIVSADLVD